MKAAFLLLPLAVSLAQTSPPAPNPHVEREVAKALSKLMYVSVFDDIEYRVEGYNVILAGEVRRPMLRADAEALVRHVEGVEQVTNDIEVLPLSPFDEAIRRATYLALIRQPTLTSYFLPNVSSIRIIVKNGNVRLGGVVSNQADADMARLTAGAVPGILSFVSKLQVAAPDSR